MKQFLLLLLLVFSFYPVFSQNNQWVWMSGDSTANQTGVYGTRGIAGVDNKPGARVDATSWTDGSGNLWLFGGVGYAAGHLESHLNDLWKYSPSTGLWTWISGDSTGGQSGIYGTRGTPSTINKPRARVKPAGWMDATGNLWLFGGGIYTGSGFNQLSDLWKYAPSTGTWTWISGDSTINQPGVYGTKGNAAAGNKPGARVVAASWTDASGNLWLFGGDGYSNRYGMGGYSGYLNDLWKYVPSTGQWIWMSGDSTTYQQGIYGIKGTAGSGNKPGARAGAVGWMDASGSMWLFGGTVYPANSLTELNDLWKYVPSAGQWTWIGGDSVLAQKGVYGTKGIAASGNKPGARSFGAGWTDASGNFWLFGGGGFVDNRSDGLYYGGYMNDLWKYMPAVGQWTWMSGDSTTYQLGRYGTKGTADLANKPGARAYGVSWADALGNLWLFGGAYSYFDSSFSYLNDLWQYMPSRPAALPVHYSSFTARKLLQTVLLNWSTAQEQNSRYFTIERSSNGTAYDSIGNVTAGGTTFSLAYYSFTDIAPLHGAGYYRLKQLDQDGTIMYSGIAKVVMDNDAAHFNIIQNPVQSMLQLRVHLASPQKLTLQVRDMNGHLLMVEERMGSKGSAVYAVPVGSLAKGTYLVSMLTESTSSTQMFIRQ